MTSDGVWTPTPAYDLTLSTGMNGEHTLDIAGEGAKPEWRHVVEEAKRASIAKGDAETIFQQVKSAVGKWPGFAGKAGLPEKRTEQVDYLLNGRGPEPKEAVDLAATPASP